MELVEMIITPAQLETIVSQTGANITYGSNRAIPSFELTFVELSVDGDTLTAYTKSAGEMRSSVTISGIDKIRLISHPETYVKAYALIYNNGLVTALCLSAQEPVRWTALLNS